MRSNLTTTIALLAGITALAFALAGCAKFDEQMSPRRIETTLWWAAPVEAAGTAEIWRCFVPDGFAGPYMTNSAWVSDPSWSPDGTRLVFTSKTTDNNGDICIVNGDGSEFVRVTANTDVEYQPTWSPNGRIAYIYEDGGGGGGGWSLGYFRQIRLVTATGDQSGSAGYNTSAQYPAWSPDGHRLAFTSTGAFGGIGVGSGISIIEADGSGLTAITDSADYEPSWSPDGSRITFTSKRDGNDEIYVMNANGSGQVRITDLSSSDAGPDWSPDGSKIAFTSNRGENYDLYVMDIDGSNVVQLTQTSEDERGPDWSPDGRTIAFVAGPSTIYLINSDGSDLRKLAEFGAADIDPAWTSDGERMAFSSNRYGDLDLFVMPYSDPYKPLQLLASHGADLQPSWSPDNGRLAFTSERDGNREIYRWDGAGTGVRFDGECRGGRGTSLVSGRWPHRVRERPGR
jgi:Tol biopolymer transport system component